MLVWTATGLAGLFAHGAWPDGVTYPGTPIALRHLVSAPHDMAAAWPDTPKAQLSGYGLFWGILIGELMVLLVLTIFTLGTVTRYRAVRAARRATAREARRRRTRPGRRNARAAGPREAREAREPARETARPRPGATASTAVHGATASAAPNEDAPARPATSTAPAPLPTPRPRPPAPSPSSAPLPRPPPRPRNRPPRRTRPPPRPVRHRPRRSPSRRPLTAAAAAPGPLIVATTDPALWSETKDARAKLGPLLTYDPTHRLDTPARLRWSPDLRLRRTSPPPPPAPPPCWPPYARPATLDSAVADAAQTLLRCWLHAAAVDGRPFRQLHRWAHTTGAAQEPVRILRTSPKASAGQAGELESVLTAHPERREAAQSWSAAR